MLDGELARQKRLKEVIGKDPKLADRLDEKKLFQNYKQLQFIDTLALYFNRVHRERARPQTFEHVPLNAEEDTSVTIQAAEKPGSTRFRRFPLRPAMRSSLSPGAASVRVKTKPRAAGPQC